MSDAEKRADEVLEGFYASPPPGSISHFQLYERILALIKLHDTTLTEAVKFGESVFHDSLHNAGTALEAQRELKDLLGQITAVREIAIGRAAEIERHSDTVERGFKFSRLAYDLIGQLALLARQPR